MHSHKQTPGSKQRRKQTKRRLHTPSMQSTRSRSSTSSSALTLNHHPDCLHPYTPPSPSRLLSQALEAEKKARGRAHVKHTCKFCREEYPSKNALFRHLRGVGECGVRFQAGE